MVDDAELARLLGEPEADGIQTYVLPRGLNSRQAFFDAVRATLPLDPPIVGDRSWDALSDSLWGGLDALASERLLIVWPNADAMNQSPADLRTALRVLSDVAEMLADVNATNGRPKTLTVYVGGA